jgi:hypothetical protein
MALTTPQISTDNRRKKMPDHKWVKKAASNLHEGALTKMGWPDADKLVAAARKDRATVMRRLGFLANAGGNAHAQAIIAKIKKELGTSENKKEK